MVCDVRRDASLVGIILAGLFLLASSVGCGPTSSSTAWQTGQGPPPSPDDLIVRVRELYSQAPAYSDSGMLVLTYRLQGTPQEERHPLSTVFDRDKASDVQRFALRAHWNQGNQQIAVFDPATGNLGGQVVMRENVEFANQTRWPNDSILSHFASGSAELPLASTTVSNWLNSLPLVLATSNSDQPWFVGKRELLDSAFLDGHECYRLKVATPAGRCVVWVDTQELLVRRVELPVTVLDEKLLGQSGVEEPRLVLDLGDAAWSTEPQADRLVWSAPTDARLVRHFVSLPTPFPSETVGFRPIDVTFARVHGEAFSSTQYNGSPVSLFWFSSDPICRGPLQEFQRVAKQVSASGTQMYAVCTDPPAELPAAKLETLLRSWNVSPDLVLRDPNQVGKTVFDVTMLPTVIVMGADGRVQFFDVIDDGAVATELTAVLQRLAEGQEIAQEMRDEYRNYLKLYETQLVDAAWDRSSISNIQNASFAPQRMPDRFQLDAGQTVSGLQAAGNPGIVETEHGFEMVVFDGFQTLRRLNADGSIQATIDLGNDPQDNYTQVRGCRVGQKVYWAVSSVLGTRLKLIAADSVVATIDRSMAAPIRDWVLGDADSDGRVDLWIGHWQQDGLVRFDDQGVQVAASTTVPSIASLAWIGDSSAATPGLWATSRDGGLFRVAADLSTTESVSVETWQIAHVFASESSKGECTLLTLALDGRGAVHAVAFDSAWRERWSIRLSHDVFQEQVQFVREGAIGEQGLWAIARPDGTIHLVDDSGESKDRFQVGSEIRGVAVSSGDDAAALWVSTAEGLLRWSIRPQDIQARTESNQTVR